MPKLAPVSHSLFTKFLEYMGCEYLRHRGDHVLYTKPGLKRPITFRRIGDIPIMHIKTNIKTLGISTKEFFIIIDKLKSKKSL